MPTPGHLITIGAAWVASHQATRETARPTPGPKHIVIEVDLPAGSEASALVRGFAACLASVTETPVGGLPLPGTDLPVAETLDELAADGLAVDLAATRRNILTSGPGHLRRLIHRGGLRVDVLTEGSIVIGAPIRSGQPEP